jgi:hypothetical protein
LHYLAILLTAAGLRFEDAMAGNLAKLRARYPEGFSGERSVAKDRAAEQAARDAAITNLTQDGHGWAEPPANEV